MPIAILLDWLVGAELDPASDGNLGLAGVDQADAGGDRLVGRDARHRHRVAGGGEGETWQGIEPYFLYYKRKGQPAVKAASLAMFDVRTSC